MANNSRKSKAWTFLIYPESAPANWIQILEDTHIPILISPLHDRDVWQDTHDDHIEGELKKPHYHCMIIFNGGTRASQALAALQPLGINYVEPVNSINTLTRYFIHLDNKDKAQYSESDIVSLNGAPIDISRQLSPEEKKQIGIDVVNWIRDNKIVEYQDVVYHAVDCEPDWIEYVFSRTIFLTGLLRSIRYSGSDRSKVRNKTDEQLAQDMNADEALEQVDAR